MRWGDEAQPVLLLAIPFLHMYRGSHLVIGIQMSAPDY